MLLRATSHPPLTPAWTWYERLCLPHSQSSPFTQVSPSNRRAAFQMDALAVPADRHEGWYLSLMAPNVKGPTFAWLDPSRLYCNSQVTNRLLILFLLSSLSLKNSIKLILNCRKIQAGCVLSLCLRLIQALADCVKDLLSPFRNDTVDLVAGIDAMGFILGKKSKPIRFGKEKKWSVKSNWTWCVTDFYFKRQFALVRKPNPAGKETKFRYSGSCKLHGTWHDILHPVQTHCDNFEISFCRCGWMFFVLFCFFRGVCCHHPWKRFSGYPQSRTPVCRDTKPKLQRLHRQRKDYGSKTGCAKTG